MEAIAALSLAVNIIQVVTWGQKVVSIYDDFAKNGELYPPQRKAVLCLENATTSLQNALSSQTQPITADQYNLLDIARQSEVAADKLLKQLEPANDAGRLKLTVKALVKGSLIKKLAGELEMYRNALETQLLLDLR